MLVGMIKQNLSWAVTPVDMRPQCRREIKNEHNTGNQSTVGTVLKRHNARFQLGMNNGSAC